MTVKEFLNLTEHASKNIEGNRKCFNKSSCDGGLGLKSLSLSSGDKCQKDFTPDGKWTQSKGGEREEINFKPYLQTTFVTFVFLKPSVLFFYLFLMP